MAIGDYSLVPGSPNMNWGQLQMPGSASDFNWGGMQQPQAQGFGLNSGTIGQGLTGLATVGNIWNAFQTQKMAKEQFNYIKSVGETNLANQISSYNTSLSDRARSRGATEGQSAEQVQSYIDTNKLTRK